MTLDLQNEAFRSSQDERHREKTLNTHPVVPLLPTHALTKGGPSAILPTPNLLLIQLLAATAGAGVGDVSEAELKGRKGGSFPTSFIRL